jgi:rhodanese-related sulfurtransferase
MSMFTMGDRVPTIEPHAADALIKDGTALLVDYGEPHEWFAGHLPHSLLISCHFPPDRSHLPRDHKLIIGARHAGMAEELVEDLLADGFDAAMLAGGVSGWEHAGLPLLLPDGTPRR